MSNPVVELLKAEIGKDFSKSASPVGRWLNGSIQEVEEGRLVVQFEVREEMTNPMGILHGGMSALIIDEIAGAAVYTLNRDTFFTSINLSLDFLRSVPLGNKITAEAEVIRAGKTIINVECRIRNEEGEIISKAMTNLVRTFQKKTSRVK